MREVGGEQAYREVLFLLMPPIKGLRKQEEDAEFTSKAFFVYLTFFPSLLSRDHLESDSRVVMYGVKWTFATTLRG